jgi:hypothetical protein
MLRHGDRRWHDANFSALGPPSRPFAFGGQLTRFSDYADFGLGSGWTSAGLAEAKVIGTLYDLRGHCYAVHSNGMPGTSISRCLLMLSLRAIVFATRAIGMCLAMVVSATLAWTLLHLDRLIRGQLCTPAHRQSLPIQYLERSLIFSLLLRQPEHVATACR